MSPCQRLKYKIGDLFEVVEVVEGVSPFDKGSVIRLAYDNNSACPLFSLVSGRCFLTTARTILQAPCCGKRIN